MSWKDEEIDKLFQESASSGSFEYKNEYWKEFEKSLPIRDKGRDFLWIATALLFLGIVTVGSVLRQDGVNTPNNGTALTAELKAADNENAQSERLNTSNGTNETNEITDGNVNSAPLGLNATENASVTQSRYASTTNTEVNSEIRNNNVQPSAHKLPIVAIVTTGPTALEIEQARLAKEKIAAQLAQQLKQQLSQNPFQRANLNPLKPINNKEETFVDQLALRSIASDLDRQKMPDLLMKPNSLVPVTSLYIELNGGLSESIVSPSDEYSNSFGVGFGMRMQNGNLSFTAGVNGILSNHKDIQLSREAVKVYGFGSTLQSIHLNYRQIYTIEANFSMGWSVGKHTLTAGIRPSYVVGSKVQDRAEVDNNVVHDKVVYGYLDGLSRFGLKPQIGYSYTFVPGWTLGANLSVQTQQALNEAYVNGENNRFPIDGQLYLRKSIRLRR